MKLEDLTQDKLDEMIAEQEAAKNSLAGLKADLAKFKAKAKGAEIDPEAHAELQTQVETLKAELDKANKAAKKLTDDYTGQISAKDAALSKYLIDSQLSDSLAKAGVKPEFMDAVKAMHRGSAQIAVDGTEYVARIGDKPISEAIAAWVGSDAGKHFISAPNNSGGGANGGNGGQGSKVAGDFGGSKADRIAALNAKFPDLAKQT